MSLELPIEEADGSSNLCEPFRRAPYRGLDEVPLA